MDTKYDKKNKQKGMIFFQILTFSFPLNQFEQV